MSDYATSGDMGTLPAEFVEPIRRVSRELSQSFQNFRKQPIRTSLEHPRHASSSSEMEQLRMRMSLTFRQGLWLAEAREVSVLQLQLLDLMVRKEDVAVPIDATAGTDGDELPSVGADYGDIVSGVKSSLKAIFVHTVTL